jgi:hypothetical protein
MPPEPVTLVEYRERLTALRSMHRDLDCPRGCEDGWVPSGLCGGHLCDWPGHREEVERGTT